MGQEPTAMTDHRDRTDHDAAPTLAAPEAAAERHDDPAAIRRDIAETRAEMEGTLEAINDRVNPQRVYERRSGRARQRWDSLKASVMGSDDGADGSLSDRVPDVDASGRARQAREAVSDAPQEARRRTRGNPLAAGLIAFGVGALIGGALPESEAERRAVGEADRHLDLAQTRQRLTDRAQQVGDEVRSSARDAAEDLKGSARHAAQDLQSHAGDQGDRLQQEAARARDHAQRDL